MGISVGSGELHGLSYSKLVSDSLEQPQPSGRLQVLEPKNFPYLHTGKSLVFVIARNGMVWGKRLDEQSSKGDIELEVFWPSEDGCLIRQWCGRDLGASVSSTFQMQKQLGMFSNEQICKIESILSQKEIIQYELGTLMVRSVYDIGDAGWRNLPQYQRMTEKCKLNFPWDNPCNIKVVDCSYKGVWQTSFNLSTWQFYYDDVVADFKFFTDSLWEGKEKFSIGTREAPRSFKDVQNIESVFNREAAQIVKKFFAAKLSNRKFDMSGIKLRSDVKINPCLRIMYGEYDFFEYFKVDDAVLVLEEETYSADFLKLYWTLGIAQNKLIREMMRLASNNLDLFAPLIPKKYRERW